MFENIIIYINIFITLKLSLHTQLYSKGHTELIQNRIDLDTGIHGIFKQNVASSGLLYFVFFVERSSTTSERVFDREQTHSPRFVSYLSCESSYEFNLVSLENPVKHLRVREYLIVRK